jgi:hypothetical protein
MELQQIRYFLALCEEGTFTRAAERCGVSQPSLSTAIKPLEAELGTPLFERGRQARRLSALGRCVQPHFIDIDRSATAAKHVAAKFLVGPAVLTSNIQEKPMRTIFYGVAVAAIALIIVGMAVRPYRNADATATAQASAAKNAYAIEATVDVKALPTQDILSEADE